METVYYFDDSYPKLAQGSSAGIDKLFDAAGRLVRNQLPA